MSCWKSRVMEPQSVCGLMRCAGMVDAVEGERAG